MAITRLHAVLFVRDADAAAEFHATAFGVPLDLEAEARRWGAAAM